MTNERLSFIRDFSKVQVASLGDSDDFELVPMTEDQKKAYESGGVTMTLQEVCHVFGFEVPQND